MRNRTTDGATVTTPMRKLIKKLPDLAMKVCDRCFHAKEPVNHPDYHITLNYEFLDDINAEWFEDDSVQSGEDGHEDIVYKIKKALPENSTRQLQMKQNHPLILMVRICIIRQSKLCLVTLIDYRFLCTNIEPLTLETELYVATIHNIFSRDCSLLSRGANLTGGNW